jgi:hypothetical protein
MAYLEFSARGKSENAFNGRSPCKARFARFMRGENEKSPVAAWTLHDLRRAFAMNLAALGAPIPVTEKIAQPRLGDGYRRRGDLQPAPLHGRAARGRRQLGNAARRPSELLTRPGSATICRDAVR